MSPVLKKDMPIEDQHNQTKSGSKENGQPQDVDSPGPMDVDTAEDVVLHRPQRLLEDEKVHLQRSGIKLSDFEVRGTLGTWGFSNLLDLLPTPFSRDRDFWKSASCSPPEHSCTNDFTNTKPLRHESPPQN